MERRQLPEHVDTVIIGGGPASLILSYILHGNVPYYARKHEDDLLDARLSANPILLNIDPQTFLHFASSLRYSTQALPLNTLLDTLIRPNADIEINPESCVEWRKEPKRAISHVILTSGHLPGGQWVDNPVDASMDIGTLSYSEMLSLPGYSYADHYETRHMSKLPEFERPSRAEVADYFATYPVAIGLTDSIHTSIKVDQISRTEDGFLVGSHGIRCKHLVLASGIFSLNIAPRPELTPLVPLHNEEEPLLVIGSGFSAADVIISSPPRRKIIHIFKWAPDTRPSPLRGCHHQAYPEYAGIYRQMKLSAALTRKAQAVSPMTRRRSNPFFSHRDWGSVYEGLSNAWVKSVSLENNKATIHIRLETGEVVSRVVGGLAYVIGRRGTLEYLDPSLCDEVLGRRDAHQDNLISGRTLRAKVEQSFEVARDVFVIGSLAGDSLVRHAFGGCVSVAGSIMGVQKSSNNRGGLLVDMPVPSNGTTHEDLHIDRREALQA